MIRLGVYWVLALIREICSYSFHFNIVPPHAARYALRCNDGLYGLNYELSLLCRRDAKLLGDWGLFDHHEPFWTFCAAFATSVAAIAAALSAYYSKKITDQTEVSSQLDRILTLQDKFTSEYIKQRRSVASGVAIAALRQGDPFRTDLTEMEEIIDFFATVGFLANRGAVSYEMAWHEFHYWIYGYVSMCHCHMKRVQNDDPQRWVELDKLYSALLEIECLRSGRLLPRYESVDGLKQFFDFELTGTG